MMKWKLLVILLLVGSCQPRPQYHTDVHHYRYHQHYTHQSQSEPTIEEAHYYQGKKPIESHFRPLTINYPHQGDTFSQSEIEETHNSEAAPLGQHEAIDQQYPRVPWLHSHHLPPKRPVIHPYVHHEETEQQYIRTPSWQHLPPGHYRREFTHYSEKQRNNDFEHQPNMYQNEFNDTNKNNFPQFLDEQKVRENIDKLIQAVANDIDLQSNKDTNHEINLQDPTQLQDSQQELQKQAAFVSTGKQTEQDHSLQQQETQEPGGLSDSQQQSDEYGRQQSGLEFGGQERQIPGKLNDFGQQEQSGLGFGGQEQQKPDRLTDFDQQTDEFGQQQQSGLEFGGQEQQKPGRLTDFGQQEQSGLDFGGKEQQKPGRLTDFDQQTDEFGQQQQSGLEFGGQEVQNPGKLTDFGQQEQSGLDFGGHERQKPGRLTDFGQQQSGLEFGGQELQKPGKLTDYGQQEQSGLDFDGQEQKPGKVRDFYQKTDEFGQQKSGQQLQKDVNENSDISPKQISNNQTRSFDDLLDQVTDLEKKLEGIDDYEKEKKPSLNEELVEAYGQHIPRPVEDPKYLPVEPKYDTNKHNLEEPEAATEAPSFWNKFSSRISNTYYSAKDKAKSLVQKLKDKVSINAQ